MKLLKLVVLALLVSIFIEPTLAGRGRGRHDKARDDESFVGGRVERSIEKVRKY